MLHTLNKAWVKILLNQVKNNKISNPLFVFTSNEEFNMIDKLCEEFGLENYYTLNEQMMRMFMNLEKKDGKFRPEFDFDDVLISHDIHDVMLKDFLGRHCKRKCC